MSGDASFVNRLRCGDAAAWNVVAANFRQRLRNAAVAALPRDICRRADASDLVQQTFAEANECVASFRGTTVQELFEWLSAILDHNVRDTIRRHLVAGRRSVKSECRLNDSSRTNRAGPYDFADDYTPASKIADRAETARLLHAAINRLPDRQRMAVRMRHLEGRRLADIAAELNCSPQAAAAVIARGLRRLRASLGDVD